MKKHTTLVTAMLAAVWLLAPLAQVAAQERVIVPNRHLTGSLVRILGA